MFSFNEDGVDVLTIEYGAEVEADADQKPFETIDWPLEVICTSADCLFEVRGLCLFDVIERCHGRIFL